ncbi:polysaccharide deacetylase family protein [Chitinimonas naiadis]
MFTPFLSVVRHTHRPLACVASLLLATSALAAPTAPIRFLLTFDDGPSVWHSEPTQQVLAQLERNPVMPGIKAMFFLQTAHYAHGGSEAGKQLMRDTCAAGHLLEVHSGSTRGHIPHTQFDAPTLTTTLISARLAIDATCARPATLVRPPDWSYTDATQSIYQSMGLGMLLTDLSANDGKIYGWIVSMRRRAHLHMQLENTAKVYARGELPEVDGVVPVIATFHDTNPYTASHMTEYLQILVEEAKAAGLPVAAEPFYKDTDAMQRAAERRAADHRYVCDEVSRSIGISDRWFGKDADLRKGCY